MKINSPVFESGAAESGKSTLIRQIKIIHSHGFSKQELLSFKVLDSWKANKRIYIYFLTINIEVI